MKTSNKIILAIILAPLLIIMLLHLSLYAKYKAGDFVSVHSVEEEGYTRTNFQNIRHIAIYGLGNCRVLPSDSLQLRLEKQVQLPVRYEVHADSLIIKGEVKTSNGNNEEVVERNFQDVKLFVPLMASILVSNSSVTVRGAEDSTKAPSYVFSVVSDSKLEVADTEKPVYFKGLSIQASRANGIELTAQTKIEDLQLMLVETNFSDNGAAVQRLSVAADKESYITLKGENLQRLDTARKP